MKMSIRITVISLFAFLSVLIAAIMFYVNLHFSEEFAKKAMDDKFNILSSNIQNNINHINENYSSITKLSTSFLEGVKKQDLQENSIKYIKLLSNILKQDKNLYASYLGFGDNTFFEVIKLDISDKLQKKYNTKQSDKWLVITIDSFGTKKISLYDKDFNLTSTKTQNSDYKVVDRPWYINTLNKQGIIKTGLYDFSNIESKGLTYSKYLKKSKAIFSIDVLSHNLNKVISTNNFNDLITSYTFKQNKEVVASSYGDSKEVFKALLKDIDLEVITKKYQATKKINNKKYIYNLIPIKSQYGDSEYLISYALLSQMAKPYKIKLEIILIITTLLFLTISPVIWYFASIIVKPILLLVQESEKVKNRDFDKIVQIDTVVDEIELLSSSIEDMASSIHDYQTNLENKVKTRTKELEEKNKQLHILSITDKLTALYNRIKIDSVIDDEINKANSSEYEFCIILLDIDHFKKVNDTYGHQVGDNVLVDFAKVLLDSVEKNHIVGRWGGEEFVIICLDTNLEEATKLATKIKLNIQDHIFPIVKNKTASLGVATYIKGETERELIARADEALYKAKQNGRNQVQVIET